MESKLGELCNEQSQRDAVHVAYLPVKAHKVLYPGQKTGAKGRDSSDSKPIGIVDPFLETRVEPGQWFKLCLFPGSVTGMRHHWECPLVSAETTNDKAEAEAWLREQCKPLGCSFEDLVDPHGDLVTGEYILNDMNEAARDRWYEIQDEFWERRKIYTGVDVDEDRRGGFTCSC